MVDIFTGFGIVNSSHVTHWNFNENKNKNGFGIKAMSGDTTLCSLTCTEKSLKEISIAPVLGLVYEVVSYSLEESKNTARPFHLWRVNQMADTMINKAL